MAFNRQLLFWTIWTAAALALIASVLSFFLDHRSFAFGIMIGCAVGLVSLIFLHKEVAKIVSSTKVKTNPRRNILTKTSKYAIIGMIIYIFLFVVKGNAAGFAAGVSLVYLALFAAGIHQARKFSSTKEN